MMRRLVVLGDMVASREHLERSALVQKVRDTLDRLGQEFSADLQARPMTTRGLDEFSAVFRNPAGAFDLLVRLNLSLWPAQFRMAAHLGEIDVAPDPGDASRMDGPAFHHAARGIERLKQTDRVFLIGGDSIDPSVSLLASALGSAHQAMTASLKVRTIETLRELYTRPPDESPPTQDEIARAMGLKSRQAVSDALRRADLDTLQEMEEALHKWLATLD